eukprot:TRINITY_DN6871_c0_g1_i1.p1 TRINITY_DN6871_c0_g1~~TRINITY_DN6871_c0_g1_i1.p1  ORF type:complete len:469 (-),score=163.45 TRINITY_DN6871_c0_g1_i1:1130-2536(-)
MYGAVSSASTGALSSPSKKGSRTGGQSRPVVDPRELDGLLVELVQMNERAEIYDEFVDRLCLDAQHVLNQRYEQEQKEGHPGAHSSLKNMLVDNQLVWWEAPVTMPSRADVVRNQMTSTHSRNKVTQLKKQMQELIGYYVSLEEYYMRQSVQKAIDMDTQFDPEESLESTMVDETLYIMGMCTTRSLQCRNGNTVGAIINHVNALLNDDFIRIQNDMMHKDIVGEVLDGTADKYRQEGVPYNPLAPLNNLDAGSRMVLKLEAKISAAAAQTLSESNGEMRIVQLSLDDMRAASDNLKRELENLIRMIVKSIGPRINSALDRFKTMSYNINEEQYDDYSVNDPFTARCIEDLEQLLRSFGPYLTTGNNDTLVMEIIEYITTRLERRVFDKQFSQLGGLQLDKDVRVLITFFERHTTKTVRDKFAKLTQMASILYLENKDEAEEFLTEFAINMPLNPKEIERLMRNRVDW